MQQQRQQQQFPQLSSSPYPFPCPFPFPLAILFYFMRSIITGTSNESIFLPDPIISRHIYNHQ